MADKANGRKNGSDLKLDERFIKDVQGKEFVIYAGVLDLAHQKGIQSMEVEAIQYPTKENGFEAICKATVESKDGEVFTEWGDANPKNTNAKIVNHILRMAATRAKARALRDFTNIGMTCLEELGDIDEVMADDKPHARVRKLPERPSGTKADPPKEDVKKPEPPSKGTDTRPGKSNGNADKSNGESKEDIGPKPSTAQIRAIENLAKRRNITAEELDEMVQQQYGTSLLNITSNEASSFIRQLQQSA